MRTLVLCLVLAISLSAAVGPAAAQDLSALEYKIIKGFAFEDPLISAATVYLQPSPGRPADLKGMPVGANGELRYFVGTVGTRGIVVAMDSATPANLFIGRDGGNDLSDAKPLRRTKVSGGSAGVEYQYGPVTLKAPRSAIGAPAGEGAAPATVDGAAGRVLIASLQDSALAMYPAGYLVGQVKIGDKTRKIALVDGDFDGRYTPSTQPMVDNRSEAARDWLAIDFNGDGRFERGQDDQMEIRPLTRLVRLDDRYYEVKAAGDGSSIAMLPAEPKMGTLAVSRPGVELMLLGEFGPQLLQASKAGWQLPEGHYVCQFVRLATADSKGDKWALQAYGNTGKLQDFQVKRGEKVSIDLGSPLTVKTDVQQQSTGWVFRGKEVTVGISMVGVGGEAYSPGAEKNGNRMPAPKIAIYDEKGEVLASGDFQYG